MIYLDFETSVTELEGKIAELRALAAGDATVSIADEVKVYTADIPPHDIQLMIKPGSTWAATAATNPAAIGAVSVRAIAKKLAKEPLDHEITIPPTLFTQAELRDSGVKNMKQLREKFPAFNQVDRATSPWIPVDKAGMF